MRKWIYSLVLVFVSALLLGIGGLVFSEEPTNPLALLQDGNARFVSGKLGVKDISAAKREELAKGQHPYAVVVTCSDSRVAPELLFDEGLGRIFVVRTAGNVVDDIALASIEYGVEHLHAPMVMVLGHSKCGAVIASMGADPHADAHGAKDHIGALVKEIAPAVAVAKSAKVADEAARLEVAIQTNIRNVAKSLTAESPVLADAVKAGHAKIVCAEYDLASGKITQLP